MPAPYHNIRSKCDRALMAYLLGLGVADPGQIVPAKNSQAKGLPIVVVWSERAVEEPAYSANFIIQCQVMVKSEAAPEAGQDADAPRIDSDQLFAAVADAFHTDIDSAGDKLGEQITLAARAMAAAQPKVHGDLADFTAVNVLVKEEDGAFEEDGAAWVDTLHLEIACTPNDVL